MFLLWPLIGMSTALVQSDTEYCRGEETGSFLWRWHAIRRRTRKRIVLHLCGRSAWCYTLHLEFPFWGVLTNNKVEVSVWVRSEGHLPWRPLRRVYATGTAKTVLQPAPAAACSEGRYEQRKTAGPEARSRKESRGCKRWVVGDSKWRRWKWLSLFSLCVLASPLFCSGHYCHVSFSSHSFFYYDQEDWSRKSKSHAIWQEAGVGSLLHPWAMSLQADRREGARKSVWGKAKDYTPGKGRVVVGRALGLPR